MAELWDALDEAMAGQGRSVMLAGEPGIGKTRTAQELGSHAAALGVKLLWGWCHEREGAPPYWPWIQSMRSYILETDSTELRSQMGPGASDIAQIVPEVRQLLPDLEPSPILEPEQARFRLFDSITTFLKNGSQSQPLMLVLDDLHWADPSSLMLWEFVSKEISTANACLALASPVAASISGAVSNLDPGEASIAAVLSSPSATPFFTMWARAGASLLAVMRSESDLAREHYAALKSSPGLIVMYVSSDRVLGLLAQTMGELDQAVTHFEDALTFCRKAGYRPELAWACHDYAETLLAGAQGRAPSHLD